jgi:hypothetical protein
MIDAAVDEQDKKHHCEEQHQEEGWRNGLIEFDLAAAPHRIGGGFERAGCGHAHRKGQSFQERQLPQEIYQAHHKRGNRYPDHQIEQDGARDNGDARPNTEAIARCQVVPLDTQILQRRQQPVCGVTVCGVFRQARITGAEGKAVLSVIHAFIAWFALRISAQPPGERRADISATRDGREIIDVFQKAGTGELLHDAQGNGGRAYAAPREGEANRIGTFARRSALQVVGKLFGRPPLG